MEKETLIIIADDHAIFRQGLRMIINRMNNLRVIGEAQNGKELLQLLNKQLPDIVLMDIRMPILNGIETTIKAIKKYPKLKIAALTSSGEEENLQAMTQAGAIGFLLKNIERDDLEKALQLFAQDQNYYSPELLPYFTNRYFGTLQEKSDLHITRREKEVLEHLAQGLDNNEIADKLFISTRTVEGYKTSLISKTGSKNIVDLLIYAIKNDLVKI
jgi:DNA-binding NarL/FixJ family response regulator